MASCDRPGHCYFTFGHYVKLASKPGAVPGWLGPNSGITPSCNALQPPTTFPQVSSVLAPWADHPGNFVRGS